MVPGRPPCRSLGSFKLTLPRAKLLRKPIRVLVTPSHTRTAQSLPSAFHRRPDIPVSIFFCSASFTITRPNSRKELFTSPSFMLSPGQTLTGLTFNYSPSAGMGTYCFKRPSSTEQTPMAMASSKILRYSASALLGLAASSSWTGQPLRFRRFSSSERLCSRKVEAH